MIILNFDDLDKAIDVFFEVIPSLILRAGRFGDGLFRAREERDLSIMKKVTSHLDITTIYEEDVVGLIWRHGGKTYQFAISPKEMSVGIHFEGKGMEGLAWQGEHEFSVREGAHLKVWLQGRAERATYYCEIKSVDGISINFPQAAAA